MHSLKAILYNILNNFVHETMFYDVEFYTCDVMLGLKSFEFWTFFFFFLVALGFDLRASG
jgi:hypothetical protein